MGTSITDAEDAFAVLASELRLQILEALDAADDNTQSFTQLYREVDASNTSQFAYHLTKLTSQYVQETNDGYAIQDVGRRLVEAVNAGEYTVSPDFESFTLETHCPHCGVSSARASYDGRLAAVDCEPCGTTLLRFDLRPAHIADRNSRDALRAADRQMRAEFGSAIDGVCQRCGGMTTAELDTGTDAEPANAILACQCTQCGASHSAPAPVAVLQQPHVMRHLAERGMNPNTTPIWELLPVIAEWNVETSKPGSVIVDIPDQGHVRIRVDDEISMTTST